MSQLYCGLVFLCVLYCTAQVKSQENAVQEIFNGPKTCEQLKNCLTLQQECHTDGSITICARFKGGHGRCRGYDRIRAACVGASQTTNATFGEQLMGNDDVCLTLSANGIQSGFDFYFESEAKGGGQASCAPGHARCSTGMKNCIPGTFLCDDFSDDCSDNVDENACDLLDLGGFEVKCSGVFDVCPDNDLVGRALKVTPNECADCDSSVDCGSWSSGRCSERCGGGTRTRTRQCDNSEVCGYDTRVQIPCNMEACGSDEQCEPSCSEWRSKGRCKRNCKQTEIQTCVKRSCERKKRRRKVPCTGGKCRDSTK